MGFEYHEPATLAEALSILAEEGDDTAVLAGGTDLLLRIRRGMRQYRSVVNIKFIPGLAGMAWDSDGGLEIGALTTFRALELNAAARAAYPALVEAARVVAGVQLRNLATVGGNIGNASPSADSVPPLVALGATIETASNAGTRSLPIEDSLTGPGRTALRVGEVFTGIKVPVPAPLSGNAFMRFGPRSAMDIGIASVATSVTLDADGRCTDCRIALGAVSPTPLRALASEEVLKGERLTPALAAHAAELAAADARPISDIRASAEYRRAIVRVLTERTITVAATRVNDADQS